MSKILNYKLVLRTFLASSSNVGVLKRAIELFD